MYTHILIPLDGSELAEQVLPHVQALAEKFNPTITLLRAVMLPTPAIASMPVGMSMTPLGAPYMAGDMAGDMAETLDAERQSATDYLTSVAERLSNAGFQVTHEVTEGHIATLIIERASALGVDLVAMTTHGRSGLERVILGSVADEVVRRSNCPILLVRASEVNS